MTAKDPDTKSPQAMASPSSGNGSEELAIARRYLNATDGQRNSAEAVDWLWKAVAKRNAEATLLLSDVFLKGVGVPQNCDQARVLLDAAASRGSKDAAERLRHLQAFGCR
jgi:TPR repeat protein